MTWIIRSRCRLRQLVRTNVPVIFFLLLHTVAYGRNTPVRTGDTLAIDPYIHLRAGLPHFLHQVSSGKPTTVAFLGGSITYNPGWRDKVCAYLTDTYPKTTFRFVRAGVPSLGSLPHAFRLQRDVLDSGKIDLLFIEAAVNDRANGTDDLTQRRALEGIVRHALKTNPQMDLIMMAFADPAKTADYDRGIVPVEVTNQERIADHYRIPSINLAQEVRDKINNHEFSWEKDFVDLHPSPFGQQLYFEAIRYLLFHATITQTLKPRAMLPVPFDAAAFADGKLISPERSVHDSGWQMIYRWVPQDSLPTREGFVLIPVLQSAGQGAEVTFRFTGTAVGIGIISGPDAGIVSFAVDGQPYRDRDLYTEWSGQLHLPWFLLLAGGLKKDEHTLHLKMSAAKNPSSRGYICQLFTWMVNE